MFIHNEFTVAIAEFPVRKLMCSVDILALKKRWPIDKVSF